MAVRRGADATASGGPGLVLAVRCRDDGRGGPDLEPDGQILAVGLLDDPTLLRLTIAPDAQRDEELAQQLMEDVTEPERGVLIEGKVSVEAPMGALVQDLLFEVGWNADEPWTPLRRDLTEPVKDPGVRIEVILRGGCRRTARPNSRSRCNRRMPARPE